MAAIVGPGGPSMATKFALDGRGDQLWRGTTCGVTDPMQNPGQSRIFYKAGQTAKT